MDVAVAQPASPENITLQISSYNTNGQLLSANISLADVINSTNGKWYKVSVPVSQLTKTGTTTLLNFETYGDFLNGGLVGTDTGLFGRHFRVAVNNNNVRDTEPVTATIAIDNIMIVPATE